MKSLELAQTITTLDGRYLPGNDLGFREFLDIMEKGGKLFGYQGREQKEIVGFALLQPPGFPSKLKTIHWMLRSVVVVSGLHHQGMGTRLVKRCLAWAKRKGVPEIRTYVHIDNVHSANMLIKCGFKILRVEKIDTNKREWIKFRRTM